MMKKTEPPDLSFPYARRTTSPGPGKAMTSRQRSALFVVLTSVVACADTGDSSGDCAGTVGDSAGIRVVQNPAEGLWSPEVGEALLDLIVEMAGKELRANAAWLQELEIGIAPRTPVRRHRAVHRLGLCGEMLPHGVADRLGTHGAVGVSSESFPSTGSLPFPV